MIACSRLTAGTLSTTPQSALRPRTTRSALSSIVEPSLAPFMILRRGMAGFLSLIPGTVRFSSPNCIATILRYLIWPPRLPQENGQNRVGLVGRASEYRALAGRIGNPFYGEPLSAPAMRNTCQTFDHESVHTGKSARG